MTDHISAKQSAMRDALLTAQKIIEREFPNGQAAIDIRNALAAPDVTPTDAPGMREALEAVQSEIVLTGHLAELVDAALAGTFNDAQSVKVPKAWFCFVPAAPGEDEPLRIRAWTTDAERAKRIGDVIGREFEPLYAAQPPAAPVETQRSVTQEEDRLMMQALRASSEVIETLPHLSAAIGDAVQPWYEIELTKHWGEGVSSDETRRAAKTALDEIKLLRAVPQPMAVTEKPRPSDCPWPVDCMWRHVPTAPEIGLHLCSRFGCPHTTSAASAVTGPHSACEHDWQIWPETDGQEQRCMKCGEYRRTPRQENS